MSTSARFDVDALSIVFLDSLVDVLTADAAAVVVDAAAVVVAQAAVIVAIVDSATFDRVSPIDSGFGGGEGEGGRVEGGKDKGGDGGGVDSGGGKI